VRNGYMTLQRGLILAQCSTHSIGSSLPGASVKQQQFLRQRPNIAPVVRSRGYATSDNPDQSMEAHDGHVQRISDAVRRFHANKEKFRIFHGSTNSTRRSALDKSKMVDTSGLNHVLKVDTANNTALVEPNVPMDRLVEATLEHGLIPPVVMEFPGITAGGGYAGTSGESSSFKHGFFDKTLNKVEMVLGNGEIVTCSPNDKGDLFHGAAGSVGSLGVTTLVEIQLRTAKKYVQTTYHPVKSVSEAVSLCQKFTTTDEWDYVDGILFSREEGAIVTGKMTDIVPDGAVVQTFSDARDPWFYLHVQDTVRANKEPITEVVPLAEYLFRYDRGGFWVGASAFQYFKMPFNRLTRWFLDDFLHTRMMYKALHASGYSRSYVVQDLAVPYPNAEKFIDYTHDKFGIYPLWLCPLKQSSYPTMHPHSSKPNEPMLNVGLWGDGPPKYEDFVAANRDLEHKLRELDGMKWFYAHTYYTEEEFWQSFDKKWYDKLREKYHATTLPSVYEKVRVDVEAERKKAASPTGNRFLDIWPISGLYGIKKAIEDKSYLAARASTWKTKAR
jgi:delta24-sterol reductase